MKPLLSFIWLAVVFAVTPSSYGQGCTVNIVGDWEATAPGAATPDLYHFGADGIVTVFSGSVPGKELARAAYKLDDSQPPRAIEFRRMSGSNAFPFSFT